MWKFRINPDRDLAVMLVERLKMKVPEGVTTSAPDKAKLSEAAKPSEPARDKAHNKGRSGSHSSTRVEKEPAKSEKKKAKGEKKKAKGEKE